MVARLGHVPWTYAVVSGRRRDASQGRGGAHSGAIGDDDNAARPHPPPHSPFTGGRAAGWGSAGHVLSGVRPGPGTGSPAGRVDRRPCRSTPCKAGIVAGEEGGAW